MLILDYSKKHRKETDLFYNEKTLKMKGGCSMSNMELDIVFRAQKGDANAFNELYQTFYKQAYYMALKITNCDADAQDATQEAFITIQKSIKDLRETKNFRKWMMQIVISKCNKIFRKNKYTILDPDIVNAMPIEEERVYMTGKNHFNHKQRKEMILKLMENLTVHQREILFLMYFEQLSIKEMAAILEIPDGTVKSRLVSAKTALKKQMDQLEPMERFRLSFVPIPLLLFFAYRKDYGSHFGKVPNSIFQAIPHPAALVSAFVVSTALILGGGFILMSSNDVGDMEQKVFQDESGTYTQKEVYYKLRDWAHCHVEMKQKSKEEFDQIMPYYEFLKEVNGPYYQRLDLNHWREDFELNKK